MAADWIEDKVVFITGGASGIGAAVAALLHGRGARLALVDIDQTGLEHTARSIGPKVLALAGDVTRLADMQRAVEQTVNVLGRIDMVWANAGIASFGPVAHTDPVAWARNIQVNLVGVFNTVHAALPAVQKQRGHVAVTASAASFVSAPCMSAYSATKAGAEAMCNSMRIELAHHGVTVSAIHPSWVATPLVDNAERLTAFKRLRAALRGPLARDMPLAAAADIVARGLCERRDRIYAPGYVRFIRWLRTPLHSTIAERDFRQAMPEIERAFASDVATHGVGKASGGA
jgi:NAD(P)-dependent dehydrogenase (short-subunit alcohol dehydrogenase family)